MQSDPMPQTLSNGVMFNAYPDSIGERLADAVTMLQQPEFENVFALFYLLPTCFNSDLDRGFSIIDYDLNAELVSAEDLAALQQLHIQFKFDLVLNHLSVNSPQFKDLLDKGDQSSYRDFFIDWNEFWRDHGELDPKGYIVPNQAALERLFMRKPGLPILKLRFPDGSERFYWNTFYQELRYQPISVDDVQSIAPLDSDKAERVVECVRQWLETKAPLSELDLGALSEHTQAVTALIERKRTYLGQMDLNARSEQVWAFYDDTLGKLRSYGARIIRLDAFAYLHKEPGEPNFFNQPGTWDYLERVKQMAKRHDLIVFPEVHSEYGGGLHEQVADRGFPIYDFFFPGLVIDALERATSQPLLAWIAQILAKKLNTINMLGCHDGIPVLDLRGKTVDGQWRAGLLDDADIEAVMERIIARGGRVKNLYGADGRKIAYYQVNATFFSALGESERKLLLARAIQMFMPGIPQVWYLDLFAGTNDYVAADAGGSAGHKEINRTNLSCAEVESGLQRPIVRQQLKIMRLRNTSAAFRGTLTIHPTPDHELHLSWHNGDTTATLLADLRKHSCVIEEWHQDQVRQRLEFV